MPLLCVCVRGVGDGGGGCMPLLWGGGVHACGRACVRAGGQAGGRVRGGRGCLRACVCVCEVIYCTNAVKHSKATCTG